MSTASKTARVIQPILLYGLDLPFATFHAARHGGFKVGYVADKQGVSMKFFESPVYVAVDATVRSDAPKWGKYTFSVESDQADFIRHVETEIVTLFDRLTMLAEPNLHVELLSVISMTYESLIKVKLGQTVGQDVHGTLVPFESHAATLVRNTKLKMTVEIHGIYHSSTSKGLIARIHSYRVV